MAVRRAARQAGSTAHYLISPDAALHLVPFAALIDDDGRYIAERTLITYVTSGRDLVRPAARRAAGSKPLVIAAPEFQGRGPALPGTEAEAGAVQRHFADIEVHVGANATKDKLTTARSPLFLHIATHGFSQPRRRASTSSHLVRSWSDDRHIRHIALAPVAPADRTDVEDALDDAGLMFAGADDAAATMTAREIASLDLRGTQLVVLSACDTGVGQVAAREGVYGLRRAIAISGSETCVVSLWKVDDEATSVLMDGYYERLRRGGAARRLCDRRSSGCCAQGGGLTRSTGLGRVRAVRQRATIAVRRDQGKSGGSRDRREPWTGHEKERNTVGNRHLAM